MIIDKTWYTRIATVSDRLVAGGVVIRIDHGVPLVALVKENNNEDYLLPKGGVEVGETLEAGARREILEESGILDLKLVEKIGVKERLDYKKEFWCTAHYFLFITNQVQGTPTDIEKEYSLTWFPLDNLPTLFWPEQKELLEENREKLNILVKG